MRYVPLWLWSMCVMSMITYQTLRQLFQTYPYCLHPTHTLSPSRDTVCIHTSQVPSPFHSPIFHSQMLWHPQTLMPSELLPLVLSAPQTFFSETLAASCAWLMPLPFSISHWKKGFILSLEICIGKWMNI